MIRIHAKNIIASLLFGLLGSGLFFSVPVQASDRVQPLHDPVVIVIDPGHGGENLGTESGHTLEKEMTLVTAKAMFRELDQYDNVKVYLTHSDDVDMKIEDRAKFAAQVGADFLFSIHYNASDDHTMFGTEVWIPSKAPYHAYGYQFAYAHLLAMRERGIFVRGIKTRLNDKGEDYYGVIRYATEQSVPAVIIEHCYVDEERDADYVKNSDDWAQFGRDDALSVAKYLGLKSSSLGVDYGSDQVRLHPVSADAMVDSTSEDHTDPDICMIELVDCDYDTGAVSLAVSAADYDSMLLYYDYSIDGGQNWSRWEIWPGCDTLTGGYTDTFQLNIQVPAGVCPDIIVRAYNFSDLDTESNVLHFDQVFSNAVQDDGSKEEEKQEGEAEEEQTVTGNEPPEHKRKSVGTTTFMPALSDLIVQEEDTRLIVFLKICLLLVVLVLFIVLVYLTISNIRRAKRRRRRRKR